MEYTLYSLSKMTNILGESGVNKILSAFSSYKNPDTEDYLKTKAVSNAKSGIAQTHLVVADKRDSKVLAGYFTIMPKTMFIDTSKLTINTKPRIQKIASFDSDKNGYKVFGTLIAQISKNFTDNASRLISGDLLLEIALGTVRNAQILTGGSVVYIECYDVPSVKSFYKRNGFIMYNKRLLDDDEKHAYSGNTMLQMFTTVD